MSQNVSSAAVVIGALRVNSLQVATFIYYERKVPSALLYFTCKKQLFNTWGCILELVVYLFTLKAPTKRNVKNDVCLSRLLQIFATLLSNSSTGANSVDPDQTGATLFQQIASKTLRQTTQSDDVAVIGDVLACLQALY